MNIDSRKINASEIDLFYSLFTTIMQTEYPEYSARMREYFLTRPYSFRKENIKYWLEIGTHVAYIGYINSIPVGFLLGRKPDTGVSFLSWLGVLPNYQRKGVGKKLLAAWENHSLENGAHVIHANTFKRDIPFYEKSGYSVLAIDKRAWFGVDHYLLRKYLQEPKEENYLK